MIFQGTYQSNGCEIYNIPVKPISNFFLATEIYKNIARNQKLGLGTGCQDTFVNDENATCTPLYLVYRYDFTNKLNSTYPFIGADLGYNFVTNRRGSLEKIKAKMNGNYYWQVDLGMHFQNKWEIAGFLRDRFPRSADYLKIDGKYYDYKILNFTFGFTIGYEFNL